MNTQAIAEYLDSNQKHIGFLSTLNGHPVLSLRTSSDRVIVVGDSYPERETLKAAGYKWNSAGKLWEKNLPADQENDLIFDWCFDRDVYRTVAMGVIALNMGKYGTQPAHVRDLERDLEWVFAELDEIQHDGLVEHD